MSRRTTKQRRAAQVRRVIVAESRALGVFGCSMFAANRHGIPVSRLRAVGMLPSVSADALLLRQIIDAQAYEWFRLTEVGGEA